MILRQCTKDAQFWFRCSPISHWVPFQAEVLKSQFTRPPFEKNLEILASTASIFATIKILALKLPSLITSIYTTPFPFSDTKISLQVPHFGNSDCTSLPEKVERPPSHLDRIKHSSRWGNN